VTPVLASTDKVAQSDFEAARAMESALCEILGGIKDQNERVRDYLERVGRTKAYAEKEVRCPV
jgi:hypothetical protein